MRAIDAARKALVSVEPGHTLRHVASRMADTSVGAVVVIDADRVVGIATDRDLAIRGLAHGSADARVDSVMSTDVVMAEADGDLRDVVHQLATHAVRRVVLERDGVAVGMLTVDDLVIDLVADLTEVIRPITAEVLFGHHDARPPARIEG